MAKDSDVPQPGPARLSKGAGPDEWLEQAKQCKYLPEADMKRLCEIVKECLMEGKNCPACTLLVLGYWHYCNSKSKGTIGSCYLRSLMFLSSRIEYTTCTNTSNSLWRYSWPILRSSRAVPSCWWHARWKATASFSHI